MSTNKDYYAILGVSPDADKATIEEAYERLAKEVQPNVDLEPTNPERMQELDEAFDVLDDPARRTEYDAARASAGDDQSPPPGQAAASVAGASVEPQGTSEEGAPAAEGEAPEVVIGSEPATAPAKKSTRGLIAGIALLVGGVVAIAAAIAFAAVTLTDDDDGGTGAKFTDTTAGTGASPETGQVVTIHFTGTLEDGTEWGTTVGQDPFSFVLGSAPIPGLDEGVATMKPGGQRTMVLPPESAFGAEGAQGVPANETVTLDVELVAISDPSTASPPAVSEEEVDLGSGLTAIDIVEGTGAEVKAGDTVTVHYSGWLSADGTRFDTSLGRDASTPPAVFTFPVGEGGVIDGWDLGVPGMKEGGKRRLIIPAALAYGDEAQGDVIPANADLIFDIELVQIAE